MDLFEGIKERLTKLEAENTKLRAELADIKQTGVRKAIPAPPEPVTPMIYHPVETVYADSPKDSELRQLRAICALAYPGWTNSAGFVVSRGPMDQEANDNEWLHQLGRSILALSAMKKVDKLDTQHTAGAFTDVAREVLMRLGKRTGEIRVSVFCMACLVMGVPTSELGSNASIRLGLSMNEIGKPIKPDYWRAVLSAGKLPILRSELSLPYGARRVTEQQRPAIYYGRD